MKKIILMVFLIFLSINIFAQKYEGMPVTLLEPGIDFFVPELGYFITDIAMNDLFPAAYEMIKQSIMPKIDTLTAKLEEQLFWSNVWFITSCVAGALVFAACIYIGVDIGIIHQNSSFKF